IDFIKGVVTILLRPQSTAQRIEVHPETIADSVGENVLYVGSSTFGRKICRRDIEEWIVSRCRSVVIESQDNSGEMLVIRFWPAKLIVRNWTTTRKVLQETAPAVVAHDYVELAIHTKTQDTAIVITSRWLARVLLERAQSD